MAPERLGKLFGLSTGPIVAVAVAVVVARWVTERWGVSSGMLADLYPASVTVLVIGFVAQSSGLALEAGARASYAGGRAQWGQLLSRVLLRHPSQHARLRAFDVLLQGAEDAAEQEVLVRSLLLALEVEQRSPVCPWRAINGLVDRLVTSGHYREAILLRDAWSPAAQERGKRRQPFAALLVRINAAEALHNLGRDDEALAELARVLEATRPGEYVHAGATTLKAWILAARGSEGALELVSGVELGGMGSKYRAEAHFTRAAALCAQRRFDEAEREARAGLAHAQRPSSERNAWFLLGSIACAAGDPGRALDYFDIGLAHRYRGQGGPALCQRARALADLGRDGVGDALRLAVERDPQSAAADDARRELAARGAD